MRSLPTGFKVPVAPLTGPPQSPLHPGRQTVARILVALGSNRADPLAAVPLGWRAVVVGLQARSAHLSGLWRTPPAEGATGGPFVNAVGSAEVDHGPMAVLAFLQRVEGAFGRDRRTEGFHGARPLDLDLLDWAGLRLQTPDLVLPHPRLHQRPFVLLPLAEIAPDFVDPRTGLTAAALLANLPSAVQDCHPL